MKTFKACSFIAFFGLAATSSQARAEFILGGGENYAILFQGAGGNTLHVTNVTINGNIGVGHTGKATDSGPSTIHGSINFSAPNTGRFSNNNGHNVLTGPVNYNIAGVSDSLNWVNSLSQQLHNSAGTKVAINGIQTIDAGSGAAFAINGQTVRVFDVTSFNSNGASDVLTINGSTSDLVAFNLGGLGNIQFHGGIAFAGGIGVDNVIFNIGGGNYATLSGGTSMSINNNGGKKGIARGIFLDPNGAISVTNAQVEGRVFGGDSHDFQFVSGSGISSPTNDHSSPATPTNVVPTPPAIILAVTGVFPILALRLRNRRSTNKS